MPQFFGRFEHSLDSKGRVVLPARFRPNFQSKAYLSQFLEGCLALWTPDEFDLRLERLRERQERSTADRNFARVWAAGSVEVEIDRQGRVPVPQYLKEYADLDRSILVVGAIERIELWDPERWEERIRPSEEDLSHPTDDPPPPGSTPPAGTA